MVGHNLQVPHTMFLSVLWLLLDLGRSFETVLIHLPFLCRQVVFTVSVTNETYGGKCYARVNHYLCID